MKAIIEVDIPDYQIGQEVSIYFKDTMMIKGVVQKPKTGHWLPSDIPDSTLYKCSECGYNRGIELISVGRVETRDECLLEILKENGFYLKYEKMPKYDREYYIIMTPKED